jgi:Abnormal spindle-like microcephaly-assoc'd, ASPM-SPD-2-Hydin
VGPGNAPGAASLEITPAVSNFGNVPVGTNVSQPIQLRAGGSASVTIQSVSVTGSNFSISGLALPATIPAGQAASFSVAFSPTETGTDSGSVLITSDAKTSTATVAVSGTGVEANINLTASPAAINFGTVNVGQTKTSAMTLKSTGNTDVQISQVVASGPGFQVAGAPAGTKLTPGQDLALEVTFEPPASGTVKGSISISSNASASPIEVGLSGDGAGSSSNARSVYLHWDASRSARVVGYYVYRSSSKRGRFSKLDESPEPATSYTDASVLQATTYYYKVTAVDSEQVESPFSQTVSVTTPQ